MAFLQCDNLQCITIKEGLREIRSKAFSRCIKLKSIELPSTLTIISALAFSNCCSFDSIFISINNSTYNTKDGILYDKNYSKIILYPNGRKNKNVKIGDDIQEIGCQCFNSNENIESIEIGTSVKKIGAGAFSKCRNLCNVYISKSVETIGYKAFAEDSLLKEIKVAAENNYYTSINGVLFSKDLSKLCKYPEGKVEKKYNIPKGVLLIEPSAFSNSKIENCKIPNTVNEIGSFAFLKSSIKICNIPNSVKKIDDYSFSECESLDTIYVDWKTPIEDVAIGWYQWSNHKTILIVPSGTKDVYEQSKTWGEFLIEYKK